MPPSNSSFIDDLSPQEKRYDLEIDPNLFISVLPNGVKTWVLCDIVLGKPRRKTLGVYPEMSLSEARDAAERVASAGDPPNPLAVPQAKAAAPAASPTGRPSSAAQELKVRGGRIVPAKNAHWPLALAAVAGIAVLVAAAVFWFRSDGDTPVAEVEAPPASAPASEQTKRADATEPSPPAMDIVDDPPVTPLPAAEQGELSQVSAAEQLPESPPEANTATPSDTGAGLTAGTASEEAAPQPQAVDATADATVDEPGPATAGQADAVPQQETPALANTAAGTSPLAPDTTEVVEIDAAAAAPETDPTPTAPPEPEAVATTTTPADAAPDSTALAEADTAPANATNETPAPATPAADVTDTPTDGTSALTAGASPEIPQTPAPTRGVARYTLTSAIQAREPTDDLGQTVNGGGADITRVYFFTDVRGMTDETVTHRWLYNDTLSASVDFDVGGWRWRTYSSKDLLLGQGGQWRVEVLDEAGEVLATHAFTFIP